MTNREQYLTDIGRRVAAATEILDAIEDAGLTLALANLIDRIRQLPDKDREELFQLSKILIVPESEEERQAAVSAFQEILDQRPGKVVPFTNEQGRIAGGKSRNKGRAF